VILVEVKRKEKEGFEVLLRRFFRDVQQSGVLTEIKKRRYFTKDVSRDKKRDSARRKALRKKVKQGY
jgi:small subunit ribosomal protein S21